MKKILILAVVFLSCGGNSKEIKGPNNKTYSKTNEKDNMISSSYLFTKSDTDLVNFMFKSYNEFKPFQQFEEYANWEIYNNKYKGLFTSMYSKHHLFNKISTQLERNSAHFIIETRELVLNEYKQYHGISGMHFDFLVERKDSLVIPLIRDLLVNPLVSESEKKYAREVLVKFEK